MKSLMRTLRKLRLITSIRLLVNLADVGCATSRMTAATTPTRARRCAPADTENVRSRSSDAETGSAFPDVGGATSTTIAATDLMNRQANVLVDHLLGLGETWSRYCSTNSPSSLVRFILNKNIFRFKMQQVRQ